MMPGQGQHGRNVKLIRNFKAKLIELSAQSSVGKLFVMACQELEKAETV
jgi:hypothetical protein